jgi:hypothetical protein
MKPLDYYEGEHLLGLLESAETVEQLKKIVEQIIIALKEPLE